MKTTKRKFLTMGLGAISVGVAQNAVGGVVSSCLGLTPSQTSGPFYPEKDQADKDNDLTVVKGKMDVAKGEVIFIEGVVTDSESCEPVEGALVEIWQACHSGRYNHSGDPNPAELDPNFQYWGRAITNKRGEYDFKTILPGAYPATSDWVRPAHIHYRIQKRGFIELTTQLYFEGTDHLEKDRILLSLPPEERQKVVVKLQEKKLSEKLRTAEFNIALQAL